LATFLKIERSYICIKNNVMKSDLVIVNGTNNFL